MGQKKYPCPVCGYLVFAGPPGSYDICPICFWEDDMVQLQYPDMAIGANKVSLLQAQQNFIKFGVSEEKFKNNVRNPGEEDQKDPKWRTFDSRKDLLFKEDIKDGRAYFDALAPVDKILSKDPQALYYWLK